MNKLRKEATDLRDAGYSYNMIKHKLGVSISTQSNWFANRPFTPNSKMIDRIKNGPLKNGQLRHNERVDRIILANINAKSQIGTLNKRDLWMIGLGLYMGEGSKSIESVRIVNSDPDIIRLSMRWFRDVCLLKNENFSVSINIYPDTNEEEAKQYWANVTKLPIINFKKTQIDKRMNKKTAFKNKLPYGTLQIRIKANGDSSKGVALFRKINGWSKAVFYQI
jgi:hypothetical protein